MPCCSSSMFVHRLTRVTPPPGGKFAPGKGLKHVGIIASEAASAIAKGLNNTGFSARGACKWHQCHHLRRSLVSLVAPWHLLTIPLECSAWQWHASKKKNSIQTHEHTREPALVPALALTSFADTRAG